MAIFLKKSKLEIESASTEKLQNAAAAAFCNFSVEADSISSQSSARKWLKSFVNWLCVIVYQDRLRFHTVSILSNISVDLTLDNQTKANALKSSLTCQIISAASEAFGRRYVKF